MIAPDARTKIVGIIGDPVAHSLSPKIHNAAFRALGLNWCYVAFRVPKAGLAQALRGIAALGLVGVNVTVPHKEQAAALVDEVDPIAGKIGAVNTIRVADGRLQGFNTDAAGLLDALTHDGRSTVKGKRCLVLGAGGGGRAAAFALTGAGAAHLTVLNRTESRARGLVEVVAKSALDTVCEAGALDSDAVARTAHEADIIVQATTATMSAAMGGGGGRAEWLDVLRRVLRPGLTVLDMVYTPVQTELLALAAGAGATAVNGLSMLLYQGARSFELWTGQPAPVDVMRRALEV